MEYLAPRGSVVPTGRNRDVMDLAEAVGAHGRAYVADRLNPIMADVKHRMTHQGDRYVGWIGDSQTAYQRLLDQVHDVPTMLSGQIALAQSLSDADQTLRVPDLQVHRTINEMAYQMPWLAPALVRLRHALSQQAIEDNVATPAARQIGLG